MNPESIDDKTNKPWRYTGNPDPIYGLAFLGALIYFIQHATSFWTGVLGFLKAIIWPAMLSYKALEVLSL